MRPLIPSLLWHQALAATPADSQERFRARRILPGMAKRLREVCMWPSLQHGGQNLFHQHGRLLDDVHTQYSLQTCAERDPASFIHECMPPWGNSKDKMYTHHIVGIAAGVGVAGSAGAGAGRRQRQSARKITCWSMSLPGLVALVRGDCEARRSCFNNLTRPSCKVDLRTRSCAVGVEAGSAGTGGRRRRRAAPVFEMMKHERNCKTQSTRSWAHQCRAGSAGARGRR